MQSFADVKLARSFAPPPIYDEWRLGLPELTDGRVRLRELRLNDAASLLTMLTSDEVARFISPPPLTIEGFERFIVCVNAERQAGRYACYGVIPEGLDTPIGIFQVRPLEYRDLLVSRGARPRLCLCHARSAAARSAVGGEQRARQWGAAEDGCSMRRRAPSLAAQERRISRPAPVVDSRERMAPAKNRQLHNQLSATPRLFLGHEGVLVIARR
jgi:hypothetical protein